ncbi:hypothetical protein Y696_13740 [Mesotoga sp. H07pep.5.4]|nr:hypothetical protein Y696_13740 [Mesotoga sp. H07pep.5.4]
MTQDSCSLLIAKIIIEIDIGSEVSRSKHLIQELGTVSSIGTFKLRLLLESQFLHSDFTV